MQDPRDYAKVYLVPGRTVSYQTGPGTRLDFRGGEAVLRDLSSICWALRRPDCVVEPSTRYVDFLVDWMNRCGEHDPPRARLELPEGYHVEGGPGDYTMVSAHVETVEV